MKILYFLLQTFPGSARSGCMKLEVTGIIYHFQMSAVAVITGDNVEGTLSAYSEQTTLFVPKRGNIHNLLPYA